MVRSGPDGIPIINGIVMRAGNRDHNFIFHEIYSVHVRTRKLRTSEMPLISGSTRQSIFGFSRGRSILRKFRAFGSLRNTSPEFKTRLYESFLQESRATSTFGQHFTPRKVVSAIHDMADVEGMTAGSVIGDPAAGVGGFVLEQMARNLDAQWTCTGNSMTPVHQWHAQEVVSKTAILAKANALVHCGDLLAQHPARIPSFAAWLNQTFEWKGKTALGSLEDMSRSIYDLIITNPPFVVSGSKDVSKLIKSNNARKTYFSRKSTGLEGLFIQFIIQALKINGHAWVLLPETFFLRTTDKELRDWMLETCRIGLMAAQGHSVLITGFQERAADRS